MQRVTNVSSITIVILSGSEEEGLEMYVGISSFISSSLKPY